MPIVGSGANHLSGFGGFEGFAGFEGAAVMVRIWFVPSRKRRVYGATSASATRLPSGDQVGVPGCASVSWIFVTAPVATSTTEMFATRHMPLTSKTAMRWPSADHAAP